ncbi:discoidin domain-containing protein [Mycoplasma crocodyli]|uniref:Possible N-acetylhexosamine-binding (F5/8C domain) protein n=1 Tax=Mycoplasma crocodyli (strain ATCC 51981 / MP145) TaxID=512564 RepID=D5E6B8_MYCCM|nr:discoidin domain-containing protein [Mycoplasma crocodyli]ADE19733.1 possible N-acetylhexosamine-binding (F5/8C domain) protein [Mycoplasma crocodyli MP145]
MKTKKIIASLGSVAILSIPAMALVGVSTNTTAVVENSNQRVNLALNKTKVTVDNEEVPNPKAGALDNDRVSRWATLQGKSTETNNHWMLIDLEKPETIKSFNVMFERNNIKHFKVYMSVTAEDIDKEESLAYDSKAMEASDMIHEYRIDLVDEKTNVQFVKLLIQDWSATGGGITWENTGVVSFELYNSYFFKDVVFPTNLTSLALNKTVEADDEEEKFPKANAVDGIRTKESRWSTHQKSPNEIPNGHHLLVDLGSKQSIKSLDLLFERDNILDFDIYASINKDDLTNTETLKTKLIYSKKREANGVKKANYKYNFSMPVEAQFVKLVITKWDAGSIAWTNTAVLEFSLYDKEIDTGDINYKKLIELESKIDENIYTQESSFIYGKVIESIDKEHITSQELFNTALIKISEAKEKLISNSTVLKVNLETSKNNIDKNIYTNESIIKYQEAIQNKLNSLPKSVTREQLTQEIESIKEFNKLLVTYKTFLVYTLEQAKIIENKEIYTTQSQDVFLQELTKKIEEVKAIQTINKSEYDNQILELKNKRSLLVKNQAIALAQVEQKSNVDQKDTFTTESLLAYKNKVEEIKQKVSKKPEMTLQEQKEIEKELNQISNILVKKSTSSVVESKPTPTPEKPKKDSKTSLQSYGFIVITALLVAALIFMIAYLIRTEMIKKRR